MRFGRLRQRSRFAEPAADEGPFVSFTDLIIGILFLFLILVAALMLMHQEAVRREREERRLMLAQIEQLQAKLDAAAKLEADNPSVRLGIVFNIYQRPAGAKEDWTFARTVQIYRATKDLCISNVLLRSNVIKVFQPVLGEKDVPAGADEKHIRKIEACGLSAAGDHWNSEAETGSMKRTAPDLYTGGAVLHKREGDKRLEMQYRVLGIYDNYFR